MATAKRKKPKEKSLKEIEAISHDQASRKNIPTAEFQSVMDKTDESPIRIAYERRNRDLDPQLVWRGKDEQDWSDLVVQAPPLFIQEKLHPKVLIDDLVRRTEQTEAEREAAAPGFQTDLFADFNGLPDIGAKTEFYQHDANWTNRMILGDSLSVMASLAEREGLRGKVQCIYLDPPYGIKFNSNFQWSTTSRDVKDGKSDHITREPEQVKAFRDTWRDGIHSYLTYLRDRLTVARDLLTESGSIFVQIGDENVHRVRALMDEVFGADNFVSAITVNKAASQSSALLASVNDFILWYGKVKKEIKYRRIQKERPPIDDPSFRYICVETALGDLIDLSFAQKSGAAPIPEGEFLRLISTTSQTGSETSRFPVAHHGLLFRPPGTRGWSTNASGLTRLNRGGRLASFGNTLAYKRYHRDSSTTPITSLWADVRSGGFQDQKTYVVQTPSGVVGRCVLMATDPGDLVLDPTCGSGTAAYVAEQWGRRWITIDTSRVALALARARIMGARYPYYLLADSQNGKQKEAELTHTEPPRSQPMGDIRQGFVYERVPHITLKSIANNAEIDIIYERQQPAVDDALSRLNAALKGHKTPFKVQSGGRQGNELRFNAPAAETQKMPSGETAPVSALQEWEVPREIPKDWSKKAEGPLEDFWQARIARQKEIDASIAAKADYEYLYDKPYEDKKKVRVAGPFTVESLSPHRVLGLNEEDELIDDQAKLKGQGAERADFATVILENLRTSGVQQAHKEDRIDFTSLTPWTGDLIAAEGRYFEQAPTPEPAPKNGKKTTRTHVGTDPAPSAAKSKAAAKAEADADQRGPQSKPSRENRGDGANQLERRAAIFIGPEFGTVTRPDLVQAAREAGDANFDVLIACAFNYDARATDFDKLGRIQVLKARMNADLHMADDLKNTGKGNLFVIFGEPDIDILEVDPTTDESAAAAPLIQVRVNGVDVFHPNTGEIRSDGPDGIACWFIDTDYDEESFFVRQAYFLGAQDPYKALRTTLKAEINEEAWSSLYSNTSRPFPKPTTGRIAIKVINQLGDEVMKVFRVD